MQTNNSEITLQKYAHSFSVSLSFSVCVRLCMPVYPSVCLFPSEPNGLFNCAKKNHVQKNCEKNFLRKSNKKRINSSQTKQRFCRNGHWQKEMRIHMTWLFPFFFCRVRVCSKVDKKHATARKSVLI